MTRIALVTAREWAHLDDDLPLLSAALRAEGAEASVVSWDAPEVDWRAFDGVVVRSIWDYTRRRDELLAWAANVAGVTRLWNPPHVLRWNTHKGYLADLEERGVAGIPTAWLRKGERVRLEELARARGWRGALVIKPAVGANAEEALRVEDAAAGQGHLEALLAAGDVLVQPWLESVDGEGERGVIFFEGEPSHTVHRISPLRDRSQRASAVPLAADLLAAARAALAALGERLLYARVDLARGADGRWLLMELEVTEPSLFLSTAAGAAERLARAIMARAARRS